MMVDLSSDDFAILGLPRQFVLDAATLTAAWRALQGRVHPDQFVQQGAQAQRLAMQWAVRANEAYQRLKDPVQRAIYLCQLAGQPMPERASLPVDFLQQQMAWREALDAANSAQALQALWQQAEDFQRQALHSVAEQLDTASDYVQALGILQQLQFVQKFQTQVEGRMDE